MFRFQYIHFLSLLSIIPVLILWYVKTEKKRKGALKFADIAVLKTLSTSPRVALRFIVPFIRIIVVSLLILAMSRPQKGRSHEEVSTSGVDIVLLLDVSTSMKGEDFKPKNRLVASKKVLGEFIQKRKSDRIGLVIFAANAFTQCPMTVDHDVLINILDKVNFNSVDEDGTAIGNAIAAATNRLRESKAKSRIIILLTDGENNKGEMDPFMAAKVASAMGVKIYTIGAGSTGRVPVTVKGMFGRNQKQYFESKIDEPLLKSIAKETGGLYFRAVNKNKLTQIYSKIDKLEKTELKSRHYTTYKELFLWFLIPALLLLMLEVMLSNTLLRRIP